MRPLPHLLLLSLFLAAPTLQAQEHRYDVFARTISPLVALVAADSGGQALRTELQLVSATGVDPRFHGVRLSIALQMPDRLLITVRRSDDLIMLCRNGQEVWASPGGEARALLASIAPGALEAVNKDARLDDFRLPFPRKQLVFLPALFQVEDLGSENLAGEPCRVLDVRLMPELAGSLNVAGWSARLWIDASHRPVRVAVSYGDSRAIIAVREYTFTETLPQATWQPPEDGEVMRLNAAQLDAVVEAVRKQFISAGGRTAPPSLPAAAPDAPAAF